MNIEVTNQPLVSIIIPTYKDWSRLSLCLEAIKKQSYPKDKTEVIVVNNHPTDECPFELNKNVSLYRQTKPGSYAARNLGIQKAKGSIFGFTDSDCIPDQNWIREGINSLKNSSSQLKVISGNIKLFFKTDQPTSLAEHFEAQFGFRHLATAETRRKNLVTANVFIPKAVFQKIGLFNENLLSGGDTAYAKELTKNKIDIHFTESCLVCHPARYKLKDLLSKRKRVFGGKIKKKASVRNIALKPFNIALTRLTFKELQQQRKKWKADRIRAKKYTKPKVDAKKVVKALNIIFWETILESFTIATKAKFKRN